MPKIETEKSGRVEKLRQQVLRPPEVCIERGYLITRSYMETEGQPAVMRQAKALKMILEEMSIGIEDGELIVGRTTSKTRGGALLPEVAWDWYLDEIDTLSTREWNRFAPLTKDEKAKMREFLPWWKGRSLYERFMAEVPEFALSRHLTVQAAGGHAVNNIHKGHMSVDYEKVMIHGLNGIKNQVAEEQKKLNIAFLPDLRKHEFLDAVSITLDAAIGFAGRYAKLAREMAKKEPNAQRKAELEKIAEACDWVPANPPRTFHEALQSVWFTYVATMIEGWSYGIGFGRPDQFLYSFYKKDLAEGRITADEAKELIALFYIKVNSSVITMCLAASKSFAGNPLTADITLGGLTREGKDAVNDLSYLFLDAERETRLSAEDLIIRVHKNTPDAFVMRACEVAKALRGKLKFLSDETTIQQLLSDGKPIELARDYVIDGCNNPTVPGYSQDLPGGLFNLPLMLELALNNGVSRVNGQQIGLKTGDPKKFKSYEEIWEAYKKQVEFLLPALIIFKNVDDQIYADYAPTPFQSALFHGCIEKGLDITQGGTFPYLTHANSLSGAPNVGDSLAAIKKAVFEDKKVTIGQLIDALDRNFEGHENVLHILQSAPKFGNDDDYVDSIVNDVLVHGAHEARKYTGIGGALTTVAAGVITGNVPLGYAVGALPDGRKSGLPLSEGGISPYQGRNVSGPTATMRSVAKLDLAKMTNGAVLNMKFNPEAVNDAGKMRKWASLIRTFLETGGALVQFNIVDTQTLKEAQKHPEKYRDLLVRVATYSAYFIELSPELQNDIIARMEFEET